MAATRLPFFSVGKARRGLPGGMAAQKEGRGGKRQGGGFAYPGERRCSSCPRSWRAPPPLPLTTPVPLQKNKLEKTQTKQTPLSSTKIHLERNRGRGGGGRNNVILLEGVYTKPKCCAGKSHEKLCQLSTHHRSHHAHLAAEVYLKCIALCFKLPEGESFS